MVLGQPRQEDLPAYLVDRVGLERFEELRALEMWNGNAGTRPMTYRWTIVQDMVRDISAGLNGGLAER